MANWAFQICVLLVVSNFFGVIAKRIGQSKVIGEILAGILLGPTVFGSIVSGTEFDFFRPESLHVIAGLSELGLILLMFEVPWHAPSLENEKRQNLVPFVVALSGIGLSFSIGCLIGFFSSSALAPDRPLLSYMLFCGIALSVTALPVLVRIVKDHENISAKASAISLSAAVYTDIFAWVGLTLVLTAHLSSAENLSAGIYKFLALLVLIAVAMWLIRPMIRLFLAPMVESRDHIKVSLAVMLCFIFAQITSWLGFHQAIGAVLAGYVFFGVPRMAEAWNRSVSGFGDLLLTPLFFAYSGLQVSLIFSNGPSPWMWLFLLIIGGCFGKIVGSYTAGRLVGLDKTTSLEIGVLMNTKGLVELVVLGVGLQTGILSSTAYSVLLLLALASTALTIPLINLINTVFRKADSPYSRIGQTSV